MMCQADAMMIARSFYDLLLDDDRLLKKLGKAWGGALQVKPRLVSPAKAANILGISVWQLYHIKDDKDGKPRFSYVKTGKSQSSRLKFNATTIIDEFERYLAEKKNNNTI